VRGRGGRLTLLDRFAFGLVLAIASSRFGLKLPLRIGPFP